MKRIIINYLNGSISNDDLERLKLWIQKPKNQEKFKDFVRINHELNDLHQNINEEKAFKTILKNIEKSPKSGSSVFINVLKYAAIFIGVTLIGYGVYQKTADHYVPQETQIVLELEDGTFQIVSEGQHMVINNNSGKKVIEQKEQELVYAAFDSSETVLSYNTLKVPYGKTFGITLSDGSKITLNAGSELKYPVQFIANEKNRTVYLNGEAFFEVAKNTEHPFIVSTTDMDVEVLGTVFNMTSYTEDDKTYTVLVEGKVKAHNNLVAQQDVVLNPNEKVFFSDNLLELNTVNIQKYVAWVQGQLVFEDDSFGVIANKLERKFNVIITNTFPQLEDINITATFKNETIDQILQTFQTYMPFDYKIKDGVITITEPK